MIVLIMIFYLYLLILPFVGIYQVINTIAQYREKERPQIYYKKLHRYGMIVITYFSIWILATILPTDWLQSDMGDLLTVIYCAAIPGLIAIHNWNILSNPQCEEIEKLIF